MNRQVKLAKGTWVAMAREFIVMDLRLKPQQRALALVAMLVAAGMGLPAAAQTNPYRQTAPIGGASNSDDQLPVNSANVPGLAGYNGRGLALTAAIRSRYETNFSRLAPGDSGFQIQPTVSAGYGIGSERLGFFVDGRYGRDIILGNDRFRGGDRANIGGGVDIVLANCASEIGGSYRKSLNLRNDASLFGAFTQRETSYGIAATCRVGRAISFNAGVNRNSSRLGSTRSVLDLDRLTFLAGASLNTRLLGQLSLSGSSTSVDRPALLVVSPQGVVQDSVRLRNLRLSLSRNVGTRLRFTAGVSAFENRPDVQTSLVIIDGTPQFIDRSATTTVGYDGEIVYTPSSRLTLRATAERSANANQFIGSFLTVADRFALTAATKVARFDVIVGGQLNRNRNQGGFVSQFDPFVRRSDTMQSYFVRVGGRIGQRLQANVEVNQTKRTSDPAIFSFTSTGAGLNLSAAFGRGSR